MVTGTIGDKTQGEYRDLPHHLWAEGDSEDAGQQQTCARCHETPQYCRGKGIARNCQATGGPKVELADYIAQLWQRIGYNPGDFDAGDLSEVEDDDLESGPAVTQQIGGTFTPPKNTMNPALYSGVKVKPFPEETDHEEIKNFLVVSGLDEQKKESIQIKPGGSVTIMNLTSVECQSLISAIHQKFW